MAHQHGRSHLVQRQHDRKQQEEGVRTVVSVKIVTMANTFTGDVVWITQGNDVQSQIGDPVQISSAPKSTKADASSKKPTATQEPESEAKETTKATARQSAKNTASTIMVATSSPLPSGTASTGVIGGLASASATAALSSTSPTSDAAASNGMSGGAKAGLALGILLVIGALLGGVLFVYHRKKKQMAANRVDDEKASMRSAPPPPPPQVKPAAPSIRTQRTMSTAPRLSLRPVTQFSPTFGENRKSGGNLLNVAAAGAASQAPRSPSPDRPSSAWERPGAGSASNPFNDPSTPRPTSPQNPFGNSAAVESFPSTPQSANHPGGYSSDFANPAPAIAAAAVTSAAPITRREVPPPNIKDTIPPSPSWTEDIPASPGPAPSGPPPVAVAGGNINGPAPAPVANNVYRIQLAFKPSMADELELAAGQLVRMLHEYDDGWALCVRMDRSQQGVVPRTCLSKHPVKPRTGPPRQGPPGPRMRGPPIASPMGPGGVPQPRPLTPSSGRNSPQPPYPVNGRNSPGPRSMSPGPLRMSPPNAGPQGRARSNSNAPYAGPRSMSPGPYGGGPQQQLPPPQMSRPRSNSAGQVNARRGPAPGPSPMNPNPNMPLPMPSRKPLPGQAL